MFHALMCDNCALASLPSFPVNTAEGAPAVRIVVFCGLYSVLIRNVNCTIFFTSY